MSHYSINASVPKTLIRFLIRWAADTDQLGAEASAVLRSVLDTAISPELIPASGAGREAPREDSESVVGPFELADFFLYYVLRFGYRPSKVAVLAHHGWRDRQRGRWPDLIPAECRNEYSLAEIKRWLEVFLVRFLQTSQFKRSAIPNAPKVGSAARCRRAATGARPATPLPSSGSKSCAQACRKATEPWTADRGATTPRGLLHLWGKVRIQHPASCRLRRPL
jgi:NH3-dependent NAD+ synthetase